MDGLDLVGIIGDVMHHLKINKWIRRQSCHGRVGFKYRKLLQAKIKKLFSNIQTLCRSFYNNNECETK